MVDGQPDADNWLQVAFHLNFTSSIPKSLWNEGWDDTKKFAQWRSLSSILPLQNPCPQHPSLRAFYTQKIHCQGPDRLRKLIHAKNMNNCFYLWLRAIVSFWHQENATALDSVVYQKAEELPSTCKLTYFFATLDVSTNLTPMLRLL